MRGSPTPRYSRATPALPCPTLRHPTSPLPHPYPTPTPTLPHSYPTPTPHLPHTSPRYVVGVIRNAELAPLVYPGWRVRVYLDGTVSGAVRGALSHLGAEMVEMGAQSALGGSIGGTSHTLPICAPPTCHTPHLPIYTHIPIHERHFFFSALPSLFRLCFVSISSLFCSALSSLHFRLFSSLQACSGAFSSPPMPQWTVSS